MRWKSSRTLGNGRTFGRYSFLKSSDRYSSSSLPKRSISSGVRNSGKYWSEPLPIWARNFSRGNYLPNRRNARSQESTCNSLESTMVPSMSKMKASMIKRIKKEEGKLRKSIEWTHVLELNRLSVMKCADKERQKEELGMRHE